MLEEAQDAQNRLLERPKFLSILFSNLDEFFMVRVARLQQQIGSKSTETGPDGMSPSSTLEAARKQVLQLVEDAYALYNSDLLPALQQAGIRITRMRSSTKGNANTPINTFATRFFRC